MNSRKSRRKWLALLVLLISVSGGSACAYRLWLLLQGGFASGELAIAGSLKGKLERVQRKTQTRWLWDELQEQAPLYWDDAVATAEGSRAELELEGGVSVILEESSLAILSRDGDAISIELREGHARLVRRDGALSRVVLHGVALPDAPELELSANNVTGVIEVRAVGEAGVIAELAVPIPVQERQKSARLRASFAEASAPAPWGLLREPAQEQQEEQKEAFAGSLIGQPEQSELTARGGEIELAPLFSYSRMDSREIADGSRGIFLSRLNWGAGFRYHQIWSRVARTFTRVDFKQVEYETSSNKSYTAATRNYWAFGGGVEFSVDSLLLGAGVLFSQKPYIRATSTRDLKMEVLFKPEVEASLGYRLLELDPFKLIARLEGAWGPAVTASHFTARSHHRVRADLGMDQKTRWGAASTGLFYGRETQNSSIAEMRLVEIGLRFGVKVFFD